MLRIIGYWLRFKDFIEGEKGISEFAERCVQFLVEKALKKKYKLQKKNSELSAKLANLQDDLLEMNKATILTYDEFYSVRKRVRIETGLFWLISISEMFLNYISTLIFVPGDQFLIEVMRWAISVVVTGASVISAEKFFEEIFPVRLYKTLKTEGKVYRNFMKASGVLILLIGAEFAIMTISEARARDIEGGVVGGLLYYGFILLSVVLPLIAGYIRRDTMQYLDPYENTLEQRKTTHRIQTMREQIEINTRAREDYFRYILAHFWKVFNSFKTYKENYNARFKITESIEAHYCTTFESFQAEARTRYYLKDQPAKSSSNGITNA